MRNNNQVEVFGIEDVKFVIQCEHRSLSIFDSKSSERKKIIFICQIVKLNVDHKSLQT